MNDDATLLMRLGLDASQVQAEMAKVRDVSAATGVPVDKLSASFIKAATSGDTAAVALMRMKAAQEAASLAMADAAAKTAKQTREEEARRQTLDEIRNALKSNEAAEARRTAAIDKELARANALEAELEEELRLRKALGKQQHEEVSSWATLATGISSAMNIYAQVASVLRTAGAGVVNLAQEGSRLRDLQESLTISIDGAREATGGLVKDSALMQTAVRMSAAGIELTDAKFADFARTISVVADRQGIELPEAIDAAVESIVKFNEKGLKQLGIVVDNEKAFADYALVNEKLVKDLTETEKRLAMADAAFRALQESAGGAKLEVKGAGDAAAGAGVAWDNLTAQLAKSIDKSSILESAFQGIANALNDIATASSRDELEQKWIESAIAAIGDPTNVLAEKRAERAKAAAENARKTAAETLAAADALVAEANQKALEAQGLSGDGTVKMEAEVIEGPTPEQIERARQKRIEAAQRAREFEVRWRQDMERIADEFDQSALKKQEKFYDDMDRMAYAFADKQIAILEKQIKAHQDALDRVRDAARKIGEEQADIATKRITTFEAEGMVALRIDDSYDKERDALKRQLDEKVLLHSEAEAAVKEAMAVGDEAAIKSAQTREEAAYREKEATRSKVSFQMAVLNSEAGAIKNVARLVTDAADRMTSAVISSAMNALFSGKSVSAAAADAARGVVRALAIEATVQAAMETAKGFAALADPLTAWTAPGHFKAAAAFGAVGAISTGIALAAGKTSAESASASSAAGPSASAFGTSSDDGKWSPYPDRQGPSGAASGGVPSPYRQVQQGPGFVGQGSYTYGGNTTFGSVPAAPSPMTAGNNIFAPTVNINTGVGDPVEIGRQVGDYLFRYQRATQRVN